MRGGKPRKDGLVPGTPEALEADRKRDAARKRNERQPDPAALPSAGSAAAAGVEGAPQAAPGVVGSVPGAEGAPVVPWDAAQLKEVFGLLIPTAEELTLAQIRGKAQKARLPVEVIREVEAGCKWKDTAKKGLEFAGPRVAAKWLNRLHVPSGTQDEIILCTSIAIIAQGHVKVLKRLDELAAAANVPTAKTPDDKKGTA